MQFMSACKKMDVLRARVNLLMFSERNISFASCLMFSLEIQLQDEISQVSLSFHQSTTDLSSFYTVSLTTKIHPNNFLSLLHQAFYQAAPQTGHNTSQYCIFCGKGKLGHRVFPHNPQHRGNVSFPLYCCLQKCYFCQVTLQSCGFVFF